ncbi:MAG: undecaprenyl/decaprenyl-phosphate alpha-N-acetylglucosaminyl 1-phosphate transferase [Schleiferiaceae bacterium]|nr:undecaprenyl/decaprenyl-phosphate alpha-N-acetylglucosaminyl 1-phosphate transferase [Schleiferiaceae bacterium]
MSSALYTLVPPFVAVVILLARLLMDFGYKLGLVDEPNERSSHSKIIPRVGGLAIFLPYLVLGLGFYLTGYDYLQLQSGYWIGLGAIVALGTLDDRLDLSSSLKFFVQFAVAAYYILSTGNYVDNLYGLFGVGALPSWLGISLSIITVVYLINAVNLIDGVDGLAAGISLLALYLFSTLMGGGEHLITFAFIGLGLIVFMGFNYSEKRKIFLGDAGSLSLGFIMATFAMEFLHSGNAHHVHLNLNPVIVAILILGYPVADTIRVFAIRISLGLSPFNADRRHMHHVLLDKGFTHFGVTTFIMTVMAGLVLGNKLLGPRLDSHLVILINILGILLIHLFVRHRSTQLRIFWRSFSRAVFNPVKKVWNKFVAD